MTLTETPQGFFELAVAEPSALAVVDVDGTEMTRELLTRVNRLSNALPAGGLGDDERFGLLVRNSVRYFEWVMAAAQTGLHPVPLNYHLVAGEVAYIIESPLLGLRHELLWFVEQVRGAASRRC